MQTAGILYSETNQRADSILESYREALAEYGISLVEESIEEPVDIDLAASVLVGEADCVIYIEDDVVGELLDTVHAYADATGSPVVGILPDNE